MTSDPPLKLALRHITRLGGTAADVPADPLLGATELPEEAARLMTSRVVVEVGGACGDASAQSFSCPLFILQGASSTLADLLLDAVDAPPPSLTTSSSSSSAAADAVVPLPFLRPTTFVTLALYMEHFYGLGADQLRGEDVSRTHVRPTGEGPRRWSLTEHDAFAGVQHPFDFHVPLRLDDLYHLSAWEQSFVLQRLLQVGETDGLLAARLLEDGAWVDALTTDSARGKNGSKKAVPLFSLEQQRACVDALVVTLEAATRLGMAPLQSLCAAVLANMLIDRSEEELLALVAKSSGRPGKAAFTPEKKKELLAQFSWLQDKPAER